MYYIYLHTIIILKDIFSEKLLSNSKTLDSFSFVVLKYSQVVKTTIKPKLNTFPPHQKTRKKTNPKTPGNSFRLPLLLDYYYKKCF